MKFIRTINNRQYNIRTAPVPQHKLRNILPAPIRPPTPEVVSDNRVNFSDVTFMMPIRIESEDRKRCITIVIDYLLKYFNTKISILEEGDVSLFPTIHKPVWKSNISYTFRRTSDEYFHKTLDLNLMIKAATTPIVVAMDSDCLFRPNQYEEAADSIRKNILDFCYPFNSPCYNIPHELHSTLQSGLNLSNVESEVTFIHPSPPPGGCLFMSKDKIWDGGLENQNLKSYGPEDLETIKRLAILGYRIGSIPGKIFHINHSRTPNSTQENPYFSANNEEYQKVISMNAEQLREYIKTWEWVA